MSGVSIHPAVPADIPQLLVLIQDYWEFERISGFNSPRIEALLRQLLGTPALGAAWVAESHGRLLGYAIVVQVLSLEHQGTMAEIDEFFVLPEARSLGVGAALLAALETALTARGCVRLELQLGIDNSRARAFYQRRGFAGRDGYQLLDKSLKR
ncbi:MAG TPA: GNAT family N-acetyltransferase [Steroidobacteraceae bacterium]|jgi:GNAT superfamily N-acetyltransferase